MTFEYRLRLDDLEARGGAIALEGQASRVTYAELAERARGVVASLQGRGALPTDPVGLLSSGRAHDEAIGLAGILALGNAAVPLDVTAPAPRLAEILRARGARAIVHDGSSWNLVEAIDGCLQEMKLPRLPRVTLDPNGNVVSTIGDVDAADRTIPASRTLACILHTSGSTGTPKPVPITWAGLDAFTAWTIEVAGLAPGDRVLRVAELIFDLAWFDHLATLRAGATLVTMSRRELAVGRALKDAMASLRPTVVYGVPSLFMKLTAALAPGEAIPAPLRTIFYAGEVFPPRDLRDLSAAAPGAAIYNFFGPTETNVCTYHAIRPADLDGVSETPIGIACPYASCSLVGHDNTFIEGPGTGELIVTGATALGGGPLATRDRVERKADGLFYFRGRIDRVVKIRGYRVEPGEVEAALSAHPRVLRAAVVPFEDAKLGKMLRAHVCLRPAVETEEAIDERALRRFLAERLPPYMVPEKVLLVAELPLTPTGKIDYRAL